MSCFQKLPNELLWTIFARIPVKQRSHAKEVCRRWRDAITSQEAALDQVYQQKDMFNTVKSYVKGKNLDDVSLLNIRKVLDLSFDAKRYVKEKNFDNVNPLDLYKVLDPSFIKIARNRAQAGKMVMDL